MSGPKSANYYIAQDAVREQSKRDAQVQQQLQALRENHEKYLLEIKREEDLHNAQIKERILERQKKAQEREREMRAAFVEGEIEKISVSFEDDELQEADSESESKFLEIRELREKVMQDISAKIEENGGMSESVASLVHSLNQSFSLEEIGEIALKIRSKMLREAKARKEEQKQEITQRVDDVEVANILAESLKEMDYEVGTISDTLFVEGGVTHFRDATWEDNYYVEMAVEPKSKKMDFHMVYTGNTMHTSMEDKKTEDDWCGDFIDLQHILASKGISIEVTNHLGAGEVPVHVVDKDHVKMSVVKESKEEEQRKIKKQKAKRIKGE